MRVIAADSPRPKPRPSSGDDAATTVAAGALLVVVGAIVLALSAGIFLALALAGIWGVNAVGLAAIPYTWKAVGGVAVLLCLARLILRRKS